MNRISSSLSALLLLFAVSPTLSAAAKVEINVVSEKEVVVVVDGKRQLKRVPAENIDPGETIVNTIHYRNSGDEKATNIELNIPLPGELTYIPDSASGKGSKITFSIDGGKTFKRPSLLTYDVVLPNGKRQSRKATPDSYTHIRWTVKEIPVGRKGTASYQGRVK